MSLPGAKGGFVGDPTLLACNNIESNHFHTIATMHTMYKIGTHPHCVATGRFYILLIDYGRQVDYWKIIEYKLLCILYFNSVKNVLQEWHAYIRTMLQFHVFGNYLITNISPAPWCTARCTRYFDIKLNGILPWADINRNCSTFLQSGKELGWISTESNNLLKYCNHLNHLLKM